jgi:hypothetical protein
MIAGVSWLWWLGFHLVVVGLLLADGLLVGSQRAMRRPQAFAWLWKAALVVAATCFAVCVAIVKGRRLAAGAKIIKCRVLRDVIPPTPPGPEGSNGNGLVRAQ